jgi:hypothetical protein
MIRVRRSRDRPRTWNWCCLNDHCGWVGIDLGSQQAALREACWHLRDELDRHHGTDDIYPYGGDYDEGRDYTITCWCGYEMTGETDGAVETSLDVHIEYMEEAACLT